MNDYLIGVQARIEDADLLLEAGRHEGALIMLLLAISATSRKCYPHTTHKSGDAFKLFINEHRKYLHGIDTVLKEVSPPADLADFLWSVLRCALEHEGQLATQNHPAGPDVLITVAGNREEGIGLRPEILGALRNLVVQHPTNQWHATRNEVLRRHPEQAATPSSECKLTDDPAAFCKERVQRIVFFLKWFTRDRRATEVLEAEKAALIAAIERFNSAP